MKDKIFIFDMDGVIVNTVTELYNIYLDFLESFGVHCDIEECKKLDGLKTEEILSYAIKKHNLPGPKTELLKKYMKMIEKVYDAANLSDDIEEVLKLLRKNNFKIALASSSKRADITLVLNRFNLKKYFDFIVSGDDVSKAKPSPEIYNLVKSRFKNHQYYVLEDSKHGITSAKRAQMEVIFFNPEEKDIYKNADYSLSKMKELEDLLAEIKANCKTITVFDDVLLKIRKGDFIVSPAQEDIVNLNWEKQQQKNKTLFNGTIMCYSSHYLKNETLTVECFPVEYKYLLAQLNEKVNFNLKELAVSGLIIDENDNTLISQRSSLVTTYRGYYEFVPSGGISGDFENPPLLKEQLAQEFTEETDLETDRIRKIKPFCLIFDQKNQVYDICCLIRIKREIKNLIKNDNTEEYTHHHVLKLSEVDNFLHSHDLVPTSLTMLNVFKKWNYSEIKE